MSNNNNLNDRERLLAGRLSRSVRTKQIQIILEMVDELPEKTPTRQKLTNSPNQEGSSNKAYGNFEYSPPTDASQEEREQWLQSENRKYKINPGFRHNLNRLLCDALLKSNIRCSFSTNITSLITEIMELYLVRNQTIDTKAPKWTQVDMSNPSDFASRELEEFLEIVRSWENVNNAIETAVSEWRSKRDLSNGKGTFDLLESPLLLTLTQERTRLSILAQDLWESFPQEIQESVKQKVSPPSRTGQKPQAKAGNIARLPTSEPMKDLFTSFFNPRGWETNLPGDAITWRKENTELKLNCDEPLGFGPTAAIAAIAKLGPAAAQTFLSMVSYWLDNKRGETHESYITVRVSDLMRHMGRKERGTGGYDGADILAKGREVWLLGRINIHQYKVTDYGGKRPSIRTASMGPMFMIQTIDIQETLFDDTPKSTISFRYHLNRDLYEWVGGDSLQYKDISAKILHYHPERQKYQILLGFCLAYYDRVNSTKDSIRSISLPALLRLSGIEIPTRNLPYFIQKITGAIYQLAGDGVIPGATVILDTAANLSGRQSLDKAMVSFSSIPHPKAMIMPPDNKSKRKKAMSAVS